MFFIVILIVSNYTILPSIAGGLGFFIKSMAHTTGLFIVTNLYSTMYLLNHQGVVQPDIDFATFTFHYVSIKSTSWAQRHTYIYHLHSTMYLLNQLCNPQPPSGESDLHSTMYLLNHYSSDEVNSLEENLHSTMYLLNRECWWTTLLIRLIYIPLCIY